MSQKSIERSLEALLVQTDTDALFYQDRSEFGRRFEEGDGGNRRIAGKFLPNGAIEEIVVVEVVGDIGGKEVRIDPINMTITGKLTGYANKRPRGPAEKNILSPEESLALTDRVFGFLGKKIRDENERR